MVDLLLEQLAVLRSDHALGVELGFVRVLQLAVDRRLLHVCGQSLDLGQAEAVCALLGPERGSQDLPARVGLVGRPLLGFVGELLRLDASGDEHGAILGGRGPGHLGIGVVLLLDEVVVAGADHPYAELAGVVDALWNPLGLEVRLEGGQLGVELRVDGREVRVALEFLVGVVGVAHAALGGLRLTHGRGLVVFDALGAGVAAEVYAAVRDLDRKLREPDLPIPAVRPDVDVDVGVHVDTGLDLEGQVVDGISNEEGALVQVGIDRHGQRLVGRGDRRHLVLVGVVLEGELQ